MSEPRLCWAVHDGRAGIRNQALGLAEAVAAVAPLRIEERVVGRYSAGPAGWAERLGFAHDPALNPPWPRLWIACGRRSVAPSMAVRRWSNGSVFVVQVQDPRRDPARFDMVIPPAHDGLMGDNVLPILGSPNRVRRETLDAARLRFADRLAALPAPRAAVMVGGASKRHSLDAAAVAGIAQAVDALRGQGVALMITVSRRTPDAARDLLAARAAGDDGIWFHDGAAEGAGENPYFAFLAAADAVLVTRDSVNMLTEAATAGKPVLTLPASGRDGKLGALYRDLADRGYCRPFAGRLETWEVSPLGETARAAREIIDRSSIL